MKKMSVKKAVSASGAKLISGSDTSVFDKVVRDSKEAVKGSLFVGLQGANADGSIYAPEAYAEGCRVMLLSDGDAAYSIAEERPDIAVMVTNDTLKSMQSLAKYYLGTCKAKKIGITGSVGKTTTKEMCYNIFSSHYKTICNYENFNNHIGVPLTAFTVEDDTETAIFEMGMNHRGEIRPLADIVRPQLTIITNVGDSHIGNLGSRDVIYEEKMDITSFLNADGVLVYNADDDKLAQIDGNSCTWKCIPCGKDVDCSGVKISDIEETETGIRFCLSNAGEQAAFKLPVHGRHNAWNAALAAACGLSCGISLEESAVALAEFENAGKRLKVVRTDVLTVIDDTYNANPESVKAAIGVLTGMGKGRCVSALADMLELGKEALDKHKEVLNYAAKRGVDIIIAIGDLMMEAASYIDLKDAEIYAFKDKDEFIKVASDILKKGDTVLLKGSHSMQMDTVSAYLTEIGELDE